MTHTAITEGISITVEIKICEPTTSCRICTNYNLADKTHYMVNKLKGAVEVFLSRGYFCSAV